MPEHIGAHSPRIARSRELLAKKGRQEQGRFLIEGPTLLTEAVTHAAPIESVYATPEAYEQHALLRQLDVRGVPVAIVSDRIIAKLSEVETPPGIVAVCAARSLPLEEFFAADGTVLLLAGVTDPGNAGTLLRSADAFGVKRVLFGSGSVEPYNPKVIRASMGSIFHVEVVSAALGDVSVAAAGWEFIGLDAAGGPLDLRGGPKRGIVVGHERLGLGAWHALCGRVVSIPMAGEAESLNAAVAGSIALYEATREGQ